MFTGCGRKVDRLRSTSNEQSFDVSSVARFSHRWSGQGLILDTCMVNTEQAIDQGDGSEQELEPGEFTRLSEVRQGSGSHKSPAPPKVCPAVLATRAGLQKRDLIWCVDH